MNRAVYLARPTPTSRTSNTALSIFEYYIRAALRRAPDQKASRRPASSSRRRRRSWASPTFHGTRDFHALLKQVTREFNQVRQLLGDEATDPPRRSPQLPWAENSILSVLESFARNMNLGAEFVSPVEHKRLVVSNDVVNLVKENSATATRASCCFTNGESASILDNYQDLARAHLHHRLEFPSDRTRRALLQAARHHLYMGQELDHHEEPRPDLRLALRPLQPELHDRRREEELPHCARLDQQPHVLRQQRLHCVVLVTSRTSRAWTRPSSTARSRSSPSRPS